MIRRIVGAYGRAIDAFDRLISVVSALLLAVVVILTGAEIIGRNLFQYSSPESVDITMSLAVLTYLVGYVVLLNRDQDVMIDFFYRRLPVSAARILDAITSIAITAFFVILLVKSLTLFRMGLYSLHPVFPVPHGIVALPVIVGAAGCLLVAVRKALDATLALVDSWRPAR